MVWDWSIFWRYREAFLYGAFMTAALSVLTVVFGTILGAALALARKSRNPILRTLAGIYIVVFRAIPALVLILGIYYQVPFWTAFISAVIALALNLAAYAAENIRAGIETIPRNQIEAAAMEGATWWQTMWHIILPQAVRNMLPNLMGEWITSIKLTSLASVIGVGELVNRAASINAETFRPMEVYTALATMYLIIILPLELVGKRIERKLTEG
ncbi:MAG: amino acid ABC transporter permease [Patescibacteria group bacterium]